jgi:hypothetical protein
MTDRFTNNIEKDEKEITVDAIVVFNEHCGKKWFDIDNLLVFLNDWKKQGKDIVSVEVSYDKIRLQFGQTISKEDSISAEIRRYLNAIDILREELEK